MVTLEKDQIPAQRVRRRRGGWIGAGVVVLIGVVGGVLGSRAGASREDVSAALVQPWPFTVSSGVLRCDAGAVTLTVGGVRYGLNGTAHQRGFASVLPIWAADPDVEGLNISLGPVITRGLALCP